MNLYQLSENYTELKTKIEELSQDPENDSDLIELMQETLESVEDAIEVKAENIAKLIKNWKADIDALKAEEEYFKKRRTSLEKQTESLKNWVFGTMTTQGIDELQAGKFKFKRQASQPSVFVADENEVPDRYKEKQPDKIDKKSILADLKNGVQIPGVELQKDNKHLRLY